MSHSKQAERGEQGSRKLRIAIVTNILPKYREGFYDRLFARKDMLVSVFCQSRIVGLSFKTIHEKYPENVKLIKHISLPREFVSWQFVPIWKAINRNDVLVIMGNPRVLSDVFLGILLRMLRKTVIMWTMAHSYRGRPFAEKVRLWWTRGFSNILLYNDREVDYLRRRGFVSHNLLGINNGLDQQHIDSIIGLWTPGKLEAWRAANNIRPSDRVIVTCCRLHAKNQLELVIESMPALLAKVSQLRLVIIGGGSEKANLNKLADDLGVSNRIVFVGEEYAEERIAPWFLIAEFLVHPGAIGLTLLHAFGYGLPVVTHSSAELHGPEFAAFEEGGTGFCYIRGDTESFINVISRLLDYPQLRSKMANRARELVRTEYNVDVMVERFVKIVGIAWKRVDSEQ